MALIWNGDISQTVGLLEESGKRELRWFGVTVGQVGFGILVSVKRRPTTGAVDLGWECDACKSSNLESDLLCGFCDSPRPRH